MAGLYGRDFEKGQGFYCGKRLRSRLFFLLAWLG
jgi:hypothetical protein